MVMKDGIEGGWDDEEIKYIKKESCGRHLCRPFLPMGSIGLNYLILAQIFMILGEILKVLLDFYVFSCKFRQIYGYLG